MIYAVIKEGKVVNLINSDAEYAESVLKNVLPAFDELVEVTGETGFAFIGEPYLNGKFIPPKPFNSWVLDEGTRQWQAPVAYPEEGGMYAWDEDTLSWIETSLPTELVEEENA